MSRDLPSPAADWALIEAVESHFEPLLGEIELVFHEEESSVVHVDMHLFEATERMPQVLVTTGMASKPMNVPPQVQNANDYRYAELLLFLPPRWPRGTDAMDDPRASWPINAL